MFDFLFPKKLGRLAYFLRAIPFNVFMFVAPSLIEEREKLESGDGLQIAGIVTLVIYGVFFIYLPRLRDCRLPALVLGLAFVPVVSNILGIILMFRESSVLSQKGPSAVELDAPTVVGKVCSKCSKPLNFANDGVVTNLKTVLCNDCNSQSPSV